MTLFNDQTIQGNVKTKVNVSLFEELAKLLMSHVTRMFYVCVKNKIISNDNILWRTQWHVLKIAQMFIFISFIN